MIGNGKKSKTHEPNQMRIPDVSNQRAVISMEGCCRGNVVQMLHSGAGLPAHRAETSLHLMQIPLSE